METNQFSENTSPNYQESAAQYQNRSTMIDSVIAATKGNVNEDFLRALQQRGMEEEKKHPQYEEENYKIFGKKNSNFGKGSRGGKGQNNNNKNSQKTVVDDPNYASNFLSCPSLQNLETPRLDPNKKHRVIVWFRNDLRIHDNPVLHWVASQKHTKHLEVVPIFCFDPRFNERRV